MSEQNQKVLIIVGGIVVMFLIGMATLKGIIVSLYDKGKCVCPNAIVRMHQVPMEEVK